MDTSASLPSVAHHMKETDYDSLGFLQQWLTTGSGCIAAAAASTAASAAPACVLIFFSLPCSDCALLSGECGIVTVR